MWHVNEGVPYHLSCDAFPGCRLDLPPCLSPTIEATRNRLMDGLRKCVIRTYIIHKKTLWCTAKLLHPGDKNVHIHMHDRLHTFDGFGTEGRKDLPAYCFALNGIILPDETQVTGTKVHQVRFQEKLLVLRSGSVNICAYKSAQYLLLLTVSERLLTHCCLGFIKDNLVRSYANHISYEVVNKCE
jgi:hypothetical protein